ncbi:MAG: hypothetical protein K0Q46_2542 [Rhodococcus erythropolis]|nr:hypothetical protein [Rhodococcus erythropolis]MDF2895756.1 hypothetical protein [Rhodococcus erythropolis]
MTDPVDTDALRETAQVAAEVADAGELGWRALADSSDALNAAADELDRLRAVIENAPHALDCESRSHDFLGHEQEPGDCTCWKADAL